MELSVEELPPKSLWKLGNSFATELFEQLKAQGLLEETSRATAYASPRRLGVHITDVRSGAPERVEKKKLMPSSIAFNPDNSWSQALRKRLAKDEIGEIDMSAETSAWCDPSRAPLNMSTWRERTGASLSFAPQHVPDYRN